MPRQVGSGRMKEKIKQITGPNRAANPNYISQQILTVLQAHETISLHILSRSYLICVVIKSHTVMDLRVQGSEAGVQWKPLRLSAELCHGCWLWYQLLMN